MCIYNPHPHPSIAIKISASSITSDERPVLWLVISVNLAYLRNYTVSKMNAKQEKYASMSCFDVDIEKHDRNSQKNRNNSHASANLAKKGTKVFVLSLLISIAITISSTPEKSNGLDLS